MNFLKRKPKNYITYNSCEIPAKLFYNEVIGKGNMSIIGKASDEELGKALYAIIDELTELEDNRELVDYKRKRKKIDEINLVIMFIEESLYQLAYLPMDKEQRDTRIKRLNKLPYTTAKFDYNKPVLDEVERWQKSVLGTLRNRLKAEQDVKEDKAQKALTTFEEMTVFIFKSIGYKVTDTDTLRTFAVFKKDALKHNEQLKSQSRNGK